MIFQRLLDLTDMAIPEQANIEDPSTKYHWLCVLYGPDPTHYKVYSTIIGRWS